MSSRIMLAKLRFLQRLIASKPSTIVKQIFTRRLYESMIHSKMKGFIPDITRILEQCNLSGELYTYMKGGHFPTKSQWKEMAALSVTLLDNDHARNNLASKRDNNRCLRILYTGDDREMHIFHRIIKSSHNRSLVKPLITALTLLAIPETSYTATQCCLCNKDYSDIVCHIITQCPRQDDERNTLWEWIIDYVDVDTSVRLFHLEDEKFVDWLFGGHCDLTKHQDIENMYPVMLRLVQRLFYEHVKVNYKWLK